MLTIIYYILLYKLNNSILNGIMSQVQVNINVNDKVNNLMDSLLITIIYFKIKQNIFEVNYESKSHQSKPYASSFTIFFTEVSSLKIKVKTQAYYIKFRNYSYRMCSNCNRKQRPRLIGFEKKIHSFPFVIDQIVINRYFMVGDCRQNIIAG